MKLEHQHERIRSAMNAAIDKCINTHNGVIMDINRSDYGVDFNFSCKGSLYKVFVYQYGNGINAVFSVIMRKRLRPGHRVMTTLGPEFFPLFNFMRTSEGLPSDNYLLEDKLSILINVVKEMVERLIQDKQNAQ